MADARDTTTWDDERVARWLRQSAGIERQLAPVSAALFDAAALEPGETVLDVGCGHGPTTRDAAAAVGTGGRVRGLDVAAGMLQAAAAIPLPDGSAPIDWVEADPVTWSPPPEQQDHDVVISRFGVMFFSDPVAAFARLAEATRPGGRLAVAVWGHRDEVDLFALPLHAALAVRRDHGIGDTASMPADGGPHDAGASSLGDPARATGLLEAAGWSGATATPHRLAFPLGGGLDPRAAAAAATDIGPTRLALDGLDDHVRTAAVDAIATALADHVDDDGHVVLGGRVLVLTATR